MPFNPQVAIDAVFAMFGKDATYTPAGGAASSPIRIILDKADDQAVIGQSGFVATKASIEVRVAEITAPVRNGVFTPGVLSNSVFTPGAKSYRVAAQPVAKDPDDLVWTCLCDPQ